MSSGGVRGDGKDKTCDGVSSIEMSGFEVKAMRFEIAIEFFGPHTNAVKADQGAVIGASGEEKPRFVLPFAQ